MTASLSTLVDVFFKLLEHGRPDTMSYRDDDGWHNLSAEEVYRRTINLARLLQTTGFERGQRAAILAENRPEWAIADFAVLLLGGTVVPVYPTLTAEQTGFIFQDSGTRIAFVSTGEQYKKVRSVAASCGIQTIFTMDEVMQDGATRMQPILQSAPFARDAALEARALQVQPDDLATLIYTSGTTGRPKGVMLTHKNITSNINTTCEYFGFRKDDGYISFLPLSHITARKVDYEVMALGYGISYCASFEHLGDMLREVKPSFFVAVPRVFEKVRQEVERRSAFGITKWVREWALRVGMRHRDEILRGEKPNSYAWDFADWLVYSRVRDGLGGRARILISGGAPLGIDVAEWYADMSIVIYEGYGLTETSPVISLNTPNAIRLGSVGRPLPNLEVKIAEDGELLVKGPSVTQGYWNMPEETTAAFAGGWFHTGDIARLDDDGYLFITDRKKDLLKTSGGKFIAPQPIENKLRTNVLIAHAVVIGDKRKYPAVLIAPHFPMLEDWARANGVSSSSRSGLIAQPKVRALYEGIIADLNTRMAHFERIKRVILVPDEFTAESGEITASHKLRRRAVEARYKDLIESLYAEPAPQPEPESAHQT